MGAALATSCAPRPSGEPVRPGVYAAPDGIKFSIKVTPQRFSLGEHVTLEATLFNGRRDVFEMRFGTGCQWDYEVAAENGRVVAPARICTMAGSELRLERGELRGILREWSGGDDYFGAGEPLPPGRYSVTVGFVDAYTRVIPMVEPVWIEIVAGPRRG
jgi:hypothetical protein